MEVGSENKLHLEITNGGDFIRIIPERLEFPNDETSWFKKKVETTVEVLVKPFSGQVRATFMTPDFELLKGQFQSIYKDLESEVHFDTVEDEMEWKIQGDGLGHFVMTGKIRNYLIGGNGSSLNFSLSFDQTIIPNMISQLEEIIKQFPVLPNLRK